MRADLLLPLVGLGTGVGVDPDGGDIDTSKGAGDAGDGDTGGSAPASIADVGRALLAGMPADARTKAFTGKTLDANELDDADGDAADPSRRPEAVVDDADQPITRETDGAEFNEDAGRWQLNGKFVEGDPPEGWEPPAVDPKPAKGAKAAEESADEKVVTVTLAGLTERGEEDIEVEVDADLAQRIQRLKNDGIRAKEYATRRAELDDREARLAAYDGELEEAPIAFHLTKMPKANQLEVARALLVKHFNELIPDMDRLSDPATRIEAIEKLNDELEQSRGRVSQRRAVQGAVKAILAGVEALIPEGTDEATALEFMADARNDLGNLSAKGTRIEPGNVATLLARRVGLYGFTKPKEAVTADPAPKKGTSARPATAAARAIADRKPVTGAASEHRVRRTQTARSAASRIAPAGAGAAPTRAPALPPEANDSIESLTNALRKRGLPSSWKS